MRPRRRVAAIVFAMLALQGGVTVAPARAAEHYHTNTPPAATPTVSITSVDNIGYGEITLRAATPLSFVISRKGNVIKVALKHNLLIGPADRVPNNVNDISVGPSEIEITTVAGAHERMSHTLTSITLDILDASSRPSAAPEPRFKPSPPRGGAAHPVASKMPKVTGPTAASAATVTEPSAPPAIAATALPVVPLAAPRAFAVTVPAIPMPAIPMPPIPMSAIPMPAIPMPASPRPGVTSTAAMSDRSPTALAPERAAAVMPAPPSAAVSVAPEPAPISMPPPSPAATKRIAAEISAPTPAAPIATPAPEPIVSAPGHARMPVTSEDLPAPIPPQTTLAAGASDPLVATPDSDRAAAVAAVLAPKASPIQMVLDSAEPAIFIPMDSHAGAAVFRRDGEMVVVFDVPSVLSTTAIRSDPVFGQTDVQTTGDATVIRIPLPMPASLHLSRSSEGWEVTAIPAAEAVMGIEPRIVDNAHGQPRVRLAAGLSSRVVTIFDPPTGARLLVGTQRQTGQGVAVGRSLVQFSLVPTVLGVAVAAASDDIGMREDRDGFVLFAGVQSGGTILSGNTLPAVASQGATEPSRLVAIPNVSVATLSDALRERMMVASTAPILGRSRPRLAVAEDMVALGMGVEALAVLDVAVADDPPLSAAPLEIALRAMAGILAGRPADAAVIDDSRLSGNDEVALWRAAKGAGLDEACAACARDFTAKMPLLLSYPQPLRDRLLPLALETMALGGNAAAAQQVLNKMPDDASLDLARGMADEMTGANDAALATYSRVAQRSDRLERFRALTRAVGVRLARREIGPAQAADALDKLLYAWRGDRRELALRIQMADLRRQVGQWRESISLLRDAQAAFPEERERILGEMTGTLAALLDGKSGEHLAPADFVALYDDNADLLRDGPWAEDALGKLADNLIALDLPERAAPILVRMVAAATDPTRKAQTGAKLAKVQLSQHAPDAAIAALSESASAALPADLNETRQILLARAEAARGDKDKAVAVLRDLGTAAAADLRATLLAEQGDWPAASVALLDLARLTLPAPPAKLDDTQQKLVMRLADAATLAGDKATIAQLAADRGDAMAGGQFAVPFRLLTSPPVRTTGDIARALREVRAAKSAHSAGSP